MRFAKGMKEMRERHDETLIIKPFLLDHILQKHEAKIVGDYLRHPVVS